MRQGEYQMEIRRRQQFPVPRGEPLFFRARLALGAMPVAARVKDVSYRPTAIALIKVTAHRFGAAADDSPPHLRLRARKRVRRQVSLTVGAQNVGQFHPAAGDRAFSRAWAPRSAASRAATRWAARAARGGSSAPWWIVVRARADAEWC